MLGLFLLAYVWTLVVCLQTQSVVKSQYLLSVISEIVICLCWFLSLKLIIADKFSALAWVVYTAGCVLGIVSGIWLHPRLKRRRW